jgi:ERCC4-type nuclease
MIIDDREHDLIARLKAESVEFTVERLPLGDIKIEKNGHMALIERKRTDDFAASISDGRWREQKARLSASGAIVIYLIEGSLYGQSKPPETLSSAIWNTMLRDKMWVIQTRGLEDTSLHLQQLVKKIGTTILGGTGVRSLLSKRKRKSDSVYLLMLMTMVSESVATALTTVYPTLSELQSQLHKDANALRSISISSKRCVGKATIATLLKHLT